MLTLRINRYYGDPNITKSEAQIWIDDKLVFECEAREIGFADYEDRQPGIRSANHCLQRGTFGLVLANARMNPVCFRIKGAHNHRGLMVLCREEVETEANTILLGYADKEVAPQRRMLTDVARCRRDFVSKLYEYAGEECQMVVSNDGVVYNKKGSGRMELPSYL